MTITEDLHKGEKIEKQITPHPLSFLWYYIFVGWFLGGLLGFLLGMFFGFTFGGIFGVILCIILIELVRRGHKYYITNERLIHEYEFITKKTSSTVYGKVQDFHVKQGLIERMFDVGTLHINTAGTHTMEIEFKGVKNPKNAKRLIEEHIMRKDTIKSKVEPKKEETPLDILKKRYAEGKISEKGFIKKRKLLEK